MPIYPVDAIIRQQAECDICEEGLLHSVDVTIEDDGFDFQEVFDIKEYLKQLGWVITDNHDIVVCLRCATSMDYRSISKLIEHSKSPREMMRHLFRNESHLRGFASYHDINISLSYDEIIDVYVGTRIY